MSKDKVVWPLARTILAPSNVSIDSRGLWRLQNDLLCVERDVKLYTHSLTPLPRYSLLTTSGSVGAYAQWHLMQLRQIVIDWLFIWRLRDTSCSFLRDIFLDMSYNETVWSCDWLLSFFSILKIHRDFADVLLWFEGFLFAVWSPIGVVLSCVCDAVHSGSRGWCTGLKVVPACSLQAYRPSVCPSVTLVDQDHIGWKSWKLIARKN